MGTKRPSVFLNDLLTRDTMTLSIKTHLQDIVEGVLPECWMSGWCQQPLFWRLFPQKSRIQIMRKIFGIICIIAELTGKQHKNVMSAIRKMEPAWEKVQGLKFQLSSRVYNLPNGGTKVVPYYSLTKTECLYIATKFNDEARAKLVLRCDELERHGVFSSMKWGKITEIHKN